MGLDVGSRRIGVALTDPLRLTAQPLTTIQRTTEGQDVAAVRHLVEIHEVRRLIVGLPVRLSQQPSSSTEMVLSLVELLSENLSIPVVTAGEQLSSKEAEERMSRARIAVRERRQRRDEFAAAIILEWYLEEGTGGETR